RATENGLPVDAKGVVTGMESLDAAADTTFEGPVALGALLAASPNAQACLARQLFRYARGGEVAADACAVRALERDFLAGGLDLKKLVLDVVAQPSFLDRN